MESPPSPHLYAMNRKLILNYKEISRSRSRRLRNGATRMERRLWARIRRKALGVEFHRQVPGGPFILDFYCPEISLAIEVDGEYHNDPAQADYDDRRQRYFERQGVEFLRFSNKEVWYKLDHVVDVIDQKVRALQAV